MSRGELDLVGGAAACTLLLLAAAALVAFVRLLRGPGLADRVVALDLIATVTAATAAAFTVLTGEVVYLRIAIVAALVSFLGTIAFAEYLERGGKP